jgi:voltage-gated potassium channel
MEEDLMSKNIDSRLANWKKITEKPMLGLSLIFLAVLILPLAHPLSASWRMALDRMNLLIWAIFAINYIGMLTISKNKRNFVKSHIFELLIVLVPALRPLRLLRLLPLIGYFLNYARKTLSGRLIQYVTLSGILVTTPAIIFVYQLERNAPNGNIKSLGDSVWWALTTVTTVGYGDRYPTTNLGRLIAFAVMLVGISILGVITASIASWFVKSDEDAADKIQMKQLMDELQEIKRRLGNEPK